MSIFGAIIKVRFCSFLAVLAAYIFTQQIGTEFFAFFSAFFWLSELCSLYMYRYLKTNGMWTLQCWELLVCNDIELAWALLDIAALISVPGSNLNICSAFQKDFATQVNFFSCSYIALSYLAAG